MKFGSWGKKKKRGRKREVCDVVVKEGRTFVDGLLKRSGENCVVSVAKRT